MAQLREALKQGEGNTMSGLAARYFGSALVYAILGMALGLFMGLTKDHSQMPTHAHIMLIGWVGFALFGFFYHHFPDAAAGKLAALQFWLAQVSLAGIIVGLFLIYSGSPEADPIAGIASIGLLVSMILFAVIALPVLRGGR
jgi:hypothetical protein